MRQQREKRTEDGEQEVVIQWAAIVSHARPELLNLYHVPNEGKRSKAEAARQQRLGLRRGVPDLILDYPKGIYHGLRVEMKVKPNKTTTDQEAWLERLERAGYFVAVCYSAQEAIETIQAYIMLRPGEAHPKATEQRRTTQ